MTQQQYKDHIRTLLSAYGVKSVDDVPAGLRQALINRYSQGYVTLPNGMRVYDCMHVARYRLIIAPSVLEEWQDQDYAAYLHELGHTQQPRQTQAEYENNIVASEVDAWDRAIDLALEWTIPMQTVLEVAIEAYYNNRPRQQTQQNFDLCHAVIAKGKVRLQKEGE